MKELKEDRARHLITRFKEWNPVKELKVLIHHAMGCDNTESWNPVKELKDTKFSSSATRANASWNPVKELKDLNGILAGIGRSWWNPVKELKVHSIDDVAVIGDQLGVRGIR